MSNLCEPEIRRLNPEVCNQIAAGEVVERPASVVKELVENALDAGADQIKVIIAEGGKDLIEVVDNGHGMDSGQARLALERHATSKIVSAADLFGVTSYGFRGEALPSIASVSDFSMTTRNRRMEAGVRLRVSAGGGILEEAAAAPVGTRVVVKNLFHSVPARKKFLKTTNTERGAILERLQRFAISHPECSFELEHNGRQRLNFTRGDREIDRVAAVLKLDPESDLRALPESGGDEIKLRGYVSLPQIQRANSRQLYFFVNRRAVRDKALLQALLKAYEGTLPRGRYPAAVLFLTVAAGVVDVNVHPAKEEVRFADGGRLFGLIRQAVLESLSGYPTYDAVDNFTAFTTPHKIRESSPVAGYGSGSFSDTSDSGNSDQCVVETQLPPAFYEPDSGTQNNSPGRGLIRDENRQAGRRWRSDLTTSQFEALPGFSDSDSGFFSTMTIVGVLWDAYIVLQSVNECYMLDQHAAHERVLFEKLKKQRSGEGPAQHLLLPLQIECSLVEEEMACKYRDKLGRLGFEFDFLGSGTLLLRAVPLLVDGLEMEKVFRETLADFDAGGSGDKLESIDEMLAPLACRMAVKASHKLSFGEIKSLLSKLDQTPLAHTCPHGRPFYFRLDRRQIEKHFQR